MRDLATLQELDIYESAPEFLKPFLVEKYPLTSLEETLNYVALRSARNYEGVVVCDSHFNRIKIKNAAYLAAHRLLDRVSSSPRNCLEVVLLDRCDDVIPLLPQEIIDNLNLLKEKVAKLFKKHDAKYIQIISDNLNLSKKEFALEVQKIPAFWSSYFFKRFDGKCTSMHDFVNQNKQLDGSFTNSFLDKILDLIKNF
jgi:hypothetical protein